jgi:hypothetical protein
MSDQTYNGWTNYETWNVNLWLSNDEGSYQYWQETATDYVENSDGENEKEILSEASYALSKRLEDGHVEIMPELTGVFADLLGASLSSVNWREIAEHLVTDALETIES